MTDPYTERQEALEQSGAPYSQTVAQNTPQQEPRPHYGTAIRPFHKGMAADGNVVDAAPHDYHLPVDRTRMTTWQMPHTPGVKKPGIDGGWASLQSDANGKYDLFYNPSTPCPPGPVVIDPRKRYGHEFDKHVNAGVCQCYRPAEVDAFYLAMQARADALWAGKNQRPRPQWPETQGYTLQGQDQLPDRRCDQHNAPVKSADQHLLVPWNEHSHNWNMGRHAITDKYAEFDYQTRMAVLNHQMNNFHDPDILRGI